MCQGNKNCKKCNALRGVTKTKTKKKMARYKKGYAAQKNIIEQGAYGALGFVAGNYLVNYTAKLINGNGTLSASTEKYLTAALKIGAGVFAPKLLGNDKKIQSAGIGMATSGVIDIVNTIMPTITSGALTSGAVSSLPYASSYNPPVSTTARVLNNNNTPLQKSHHSILGTI